MFSNFSRTFFPPQTCISLASPPEMLGCVWTPNTKMTTGLVLPGCGCSAHCGRRALGRVRGSPREAAPGDGDGMLSALWCKCEGPRRGNCQDARERLREKLILPQPPQQTEKSKHLPEWKQRVVTGNDTTNVLLKHGAQEMLLSYNKRRKHVCSPCSPGWPGALWTCRCRECD